MLTPNIHQKFKDNSKGKTYIFNRDFTYRIIYAFTGCLTEEQIRKSFNDALRQIGDKFPDKAQAVKRCKLMINVPYRSTIRDDGGFEYHYMNYAYLFVSDWEIGNAICGFNFDGSMRTEIVSVDIDEDITTEKLIKKKFPENDLSDADFIDSRKKYMKCMNTVSESNIEASKTTLNASVQNPRCIQFVVTELIKNITYGNASVDLHGRLFKSLIDEEMVNDIKNASEEIIMSAVYRIIIDQLRVNIGKLHTTDEKSRIVNLYSLIGFLYTEGTIHKTSFEKFLKEILTFIGEDKLCFFDGIFPMMERSLWSFVEIFDQEFKEFRNYVNDKGDKRINFLFENLEKELLKFGDPDFKDVQKPTYSYSEKFKCVQLPPLCFLPPIEIDKNQLKALSKYVEDRKYEDCKKYLKYAGIRPLLGGACQEMDVERNVLVTNELPKWVSVRDIENKILPFATSRRECHNRKLCKEGVKYPIFHERKFDSGNKKITVTFDPDVKHINDAAFARTVFKRFVLFNKQNEKEFTEINLDFRRPPRSQ